VVYLHNFRGPFRTPETRKKKKIEEEVGHSGENWWETGKNSRLSESKVKQAEQFKDEKKKDVEQEV